jgi:arginyl-tRNA synthetase
MSILPVLKERFRQALAGLTEPSAELLEMVRRSQDPKFGDYQANFAMPLGKQLGRPPRDVAAEVLQKLQVDDFCQPPEIAGPGFINVRVRDAWIEQQLQAAVGDPRLGARPVAAARTVVVDYSAPNVAKPMHVGHIRSTVIGDSLYRVLRFLGHRVISDNHIGDWGTQFGMILYGYHHGLLDEAAHRANPVQALAAVYRRVRRLLDYCEGCRRLPQLRQKVAEQEAGLAEQKQRAGGKLDKALRRTEASLQELREELGGLEQKIQAEQQDPEFMALVADHQGVEEGVLAETAKLHAGDAENLRLWREFLPACEEEIRRVYGRLKVTFDHTLGESFYHDRLEPIVRDLLDRGVARVSDGAVCVFLEGYDTPMLIRKKDGAFLYATTDLATLRYRMENWAPDAILYVVDHRQSLHFQQLFAAARAVDYVPGRVELQHVGFGMVLGEDGRPFKTRAGDTVGLESLLDEAVARAEKIVAANDDAKPTGAELSAADRARVAETVGIGALKYADLAQNRTSDYVFSYDKMLAMNGNTATYMQYAYARVRSIFAKGNVDVEELRGSAAPIVLSTPAERGLGLELLRFAEALESVAADYRPNQLTSYLFELANRYSTFFEACPVLRAESDELRRSRLLLCDLTARTIQKGLELLGIQVVDKM